LIERIKDSYNDHMQWKLGEIEQNSVSEQKAIIDICSRREK
jgi:hypothetical protein